MSDWCRFGLIIPEFGERILIFDGRFTVGFMLSDGSVYARGKFHDIEEAQNWYWMELPEEPLIFGRD